MHSNPCTSLKMWKCFVERHFDIQVKNELLRSVREDKWNEDLIKFKTNNGFDSLIQKKRARYLHSNNT